MRIGFAIQKEVAAQLIGQFVCYFCIILRSSTVWRLAGGTWMKLMNLVSLGLEFRLQLDWNWWIDLYFAMKLFHIHTGMYFVFVHASVFESS